jgi:hypothetical protein
MQDLSRVTGCSAIQCAGNTAWLHQNFLFVIFLGAGLCAGVGFFWILQKMKYYKRAEAVSLRKNSRKAGV